MNDPRFTADFVKDVTMFGADWCGDCVRAKRFFDTRDIAYEWIDLEAQPEAAERAREISGRHNIPVIVFSDGSHLVEPSDQELQAKLSELSAS